MAVARSVLARITLAFACTSIILSLPYIPPKIGQRASRIAIWEKALHVSSPRAPYVSTASGMHSQPSSEHLPSFFHASVIPQLLPLHQQKTPLQWLSSEVTVMSKAAVSLTPQVDTRVSASQGSELTIASFLIN